MQPVQSGDGPVTDTPSAWAAFFADDDTRTAEQHLDGLCAEFGLTRAEAALEAHDLSRPDRLLEAHRAGRRRAQQRAHQHHHVRRAVGW